MTRTYQIRGGEQPSASVPATTDIAIINPRRLLPSAGREAGAGGIKADADDVVRLELENGFVLWSRADDLIRERGKKSLGRDGDEGWDIDPHPPARSGPGAARGERGWLGLGVKVLEFFGVDLKGKAAAALGEKMELKLLGGNAPGLYHCSLDDAFTLTALAKNKTPPAGPDPILVFLHGTGSSCQGSFGKLWAGDNAAGASARAALKARYGDRAYALEHRSLTASPIQNALDLARRLPENAQLHLVSHSRGGLVGELLCLGERDKDNDPLRGDWLGSLFAADRTVARQIGLSPLNPEDAQARDAAYDADRERLKQLIEELDRKNIKVRRFVRVACPARGTTLASGRLDRWLSVFVHFAGDGLIGDAADFLLAVVKERTDPRTLPGLEAMMPGSALTRLLQHPDLVSTADLSVISGDIEGDSLWGQIKLLATDWFYGADHDLVVNTGSMVGGLRRPDRGARFLRDQGPKVCHFNYFANDKSVRWLVAGLTRTDEDDGGFQPIQAARHEEPKWRGAVRGSRSITAPRPLAVMLPGTMGSALQVDDDPVWLKYRALFRGGLARLGMDASGGHEVRPIDLLDDFYGPLLEFLARSHRVEIFPYDWRLSVRDAAGKLADKLETLLPEAERQGQPVHLVAHSMGGLVVRAMIADGGRGTALWRRILKLPNSRFMMLGTPNLGSHEAVRWLTGHNPTQAKLALLDITHGTDAIIDIVNRFPGLLELLPFDPELPDFASQSLWKGLKKQLAARWSLADGNALIQARGTWDFLKKAAPDPEHMIYVAGCQDATVVDYRLVDYDEIWLNGRKRLEFDATHEGDGTVTWRSGRLPGVKTWYVEDTAHDELCAQKRAFPGYLDLLMTGATTRLPATPPARTRAAGEPARFVLPDLPPADDIPDETALRGFGFGIARPFDEAAAGRGAPTIQVSLTHGDLAYGRHPVLVGHYLGDTIISAEKALDDRLKQALSRHQQLGLYPGPLGSHALFFNPDEGGRPGGALVVGLGQVGELSPGLLAKGARDAMLDYALRVAQWPDERFGKADSVRSAPVTCLLVGSGAGGMSARDSVEAILRGAVAANDKLVAAEMEGKVVIDRIEFLELFEDVAIAAAEALDAVLRDGQLAMRVNWPRGTLEEGQGRLRRVRRDDAPNWWQRLEIIEDKRSETLRFIATTDRARAEETLATGQLRLADGFIRQASRSSGVNAEVTKTLFEMLLPNRLKEQAPRQADLILLVDPTSARYPWELLEDRWSHGNRPPAVAAGMVRQLKTPRFRPHPAHATEANAFVVGNPDLAGWDKFCDLPGARQEAQKVANLLNANSYFAQDCIDESADSILAGLHRGAWRILHLAGHGEHEFETGEPDDAGRMKTVSGMVIGKNTFLTPGDVEQMRWVPELVFINCCHLGKTGGKTDGKTGGKTLGDTAAQGRLSLLAANLAIQFVEMGVRAVVAAGWAVDDGAAEAFAEAFYTHMLAGETFGPAARAAREDIWIRFPDANTWGAYQCYGDPGFRLRGEGGGRPRREDRTYHAPAELVSDLDNHAAWIRMQRRDRGDGADVLDELRAGITGKLGGIPQGVRDGWLKRGDVAAALGFAWGETGAWAEAVDWLEIALAAQSGDCPVRAVEQCANFRVRLSGERWEALRAAPGKAKAAGRRELEREIENAIRELDLISQRAPTPERLSLLGGACKRLAWVREDATPRLEALVNMANYYKQAHELDKKRAAMERSGDATLDPYPFTNWATARVLASLLDAEQDDAWRASLEDDCRHMIQIARERNEARPNFWDGAAEADCELVLLLARTGARAKAAADAATRIATLYRNAARRGASPREYASVREHLDFIQALIGETGGHSVLAKALAALRAAL
jgi:hypothetical protein